jgi:microcystin-dependent protein
MSTDQTLGFIKPFPYTFAPTGWLPCDGRVLPASQNAALYAVIGNTFGGQAPDTFALPKLTGNCVIGIGQGTSSAYNYSLGEMGGVYGVALTTSQNAAHSHLMFAVASLAGATVNGGQLEHGTIGDSTFERHALSGTQLLYLRVIGRLMLA